MGGKIGHKLIVITVGFEPTFRSIRAGIGPIFLTGNNDQAAGGGEGSPPTGCTFILGFDPQASTPGLRVLTTGPRDRF